MHSYIRVVERSILSETICRVCYNEFDKRNDRGEVNGPVMGREEKCKAYRVQDREGWSEPGSGVGV